MGLLTRGRTSASRVWAIAEAIAWTAGAVFLVYAGTRYFTAATATRQAVRDFETARSASEQEQELPLPPDMTLWSKVRITAFQSAVTVSRPKPLAMLRIPKIHLEVPLLEGTDDVTLDRAAGHIEGTALPGADGNVGIAGHRDGFFRGLKDIALGDAIEIETLKGRETYRIERAWIVPPDDVSVLDPTPTRSLTLVTCYPFYFVGSAPERFIVRAVSERAVPESSTRLSTTSR